MVRMTHIALLILVLTADPVLSVGGQCPGTAHGDTNALLQLGSVSPTIRELSSGEPAIRESGSHLETKAALSAKVPTTSKAAHSTDEAFIARMRGAVDKHTMRAHSAAADAQAKLNGLIAHFPSSDAAISASFQARLSSAIHASKTVREAAKVAHNLANDFADQIGSAESEVRSFSAKMEVAEGAELRSLTEQRELAVSFIAELVLGSSVLMGTSVEELETWFEHSLGDAEQKEPASWDWHQIVTALLARTDSELPQAPDATHRALHAAIAGRAALAAFQEHLDGSMKSATNLDMPMSLDAAHELKASTQRVAAILLGRDDLAEAEEESALGGQTVALPSFHHTMRHPSEEELVTRMRGMVDHYYSQDRTAVASARVKLEELVAQERDSFDVVSREAEVDAASAIVESARAVRSLAGEIAFEIGQSKHDLERLVQKLELLEDAEPEPTLQVTAQEANVEASLAPIQALLQEFLSGSAALLGSSITELQGFYIKSLAPRHSVPANKKKSWEWPAFASSGLLLLSVDPDTTQKTLDIAEAAHWMLKRLMARLDESLAETSRLLSRVPATSENLKASLGQDIVTSALQLADLLEVDFVVEEARSAAERRSWTAWPAFVAAFAGLVRSQA